MGNIPNNEASTTVSPSRHAMAENELHSILKSPQFSGSKRCQEFLGFIVRNALEGNLEHLNERFIGMELFGRPIDYETGTDSIVRVRANDVRRRLTQYYSDHPIGSNLTIHLASGTYVPEFHWKEAESTFRTGLPHVESLNVDVSTADSSMPAPSVVPQTHTRDAPRRISWTGLIGVVAFCLAMGCFAGWMLKSRATEQQLYPWRFSPALDSFWSGFLRSNRETDIVLSDASFQLLEGIKKSNFTLDQYLNRAYLSQMQSQEPRHDMQDVLALIASKNFGNSSEFRLATRILTLDPLGNKLHIYNARDYSSSLINQDNVILIGSQYTNPWQQLFQSQLNFVAERPDLKGGRGPIENKAPRSGEEAQYTSSDSVGYCVVAYLPNPSSDGKVLLIQGSSSEATEAGGDFLLSEDQLSAFQQRLKVDRLPYFEVLLKTSQARGTPIAATVAAYRIYSEHR